MTHIGFFRLGNRPWQAACRGPGWFEAWVALILTHLPMGAEKLVLESGVSPCGPASTKPTFSTSATTATGAELPAAATTKQSALSRNTSRKTGKHLAR